MKKNLVLALCFFLTLAGNAHAANYDAADKQGDAETWKFGLKGYLFLPIPLSVPLWGFAEYKISDAAGFKVEVMGLPDFGQSFSMIEACPMLRWYPDQANRQLAIAGGVITKMSKHTKKKNWQWDTLYLIFGFDYEFTNGFQVGARSTLTGVSYLIWSYNFAKLF